MTLKLTSTSFLGVVKEASYGVVPTTARTWLPVRAPKPELDIKYIDDAGYRGVAADLFGSYQGVQSSKFSYELDWYETDTAVLLPALIGPDTKTGTTAPYTHTFNMAAALPASIALDDYNALEQWEVPGCRLGELTWKLDAEGGLSASVSGLGQMYTVVGASTPTYTQEPYYLGWQATVSLNGSPDLNVISGEFSFKRKLTPRWTATNSQSPRSIFAGPLSFDCKLTADVEATTEHDLFKNGSQGVMTITFSQPASTNQLVIQCSKAAFETATYNRGKDWLQVDISGKGIYNTTDAGPALVKVLNANATSY